MKIKCCGDCVVEEGELHQESCDQEICGICGVCGFFPCPHCGTCGQYCEKELWQTEIMKILAPEITYQNIPNLQEKINKLLSYIEDIKISHDRRTCPNNVSISYAKQRIKSCMVRMLGYRVKSEKDRQMFENRIEEIGNVDVGTKLTINQSREDGNYGQEYRDVFNLCVCLGKLKHKKNEFINKRGVKVKFDTWLKVDNARCKYLDIDELIIKYCPKCNTQFSRSETYCNSCLYKKDSKKHKKGDRFMLTERQSNNPTCKNIKEFRKRGEDGTTTQD